MGDEDIKSAFGRTLVEKAASPFPGGAAFSAIIVTVSFLQQLLRVRILRETNTGTRKDLHLHHP